MPSLPPWLPCTAPNTTIMKPILMTASSLSVQNDASSRTVQKLNLLASPLTIIALHGDCSVCRHSNKEENRQQSFLFDSLHEQKQWWLKVNCCTAAILPCLLCTPSPMLFLWWSLWDQIWTFNNERMSWWEPISEWLTDRKKWDLTKKRTLNSCDHKLIKNSMHVHELSATGGGHGEDALPIHSQSKCGTQNHFEWCPQLEAEMKCFCMHELCLRSIHTSVLEWWLMEWWNNFK